ncbi:MAG: tRNA-binding protein [Actinobacteria bacterium QS_8_72_14]|jgi:tRNA-binding protein|nr:MAG: tRNA-binding protein [Actinobacteria bacterium QS_8_72_14]
MSTGPHAPAALPRSQPVDPATLAALDLRVGRVVEVAEFPEARTPSWKLTVDFGPAVGELRTSAQITNYRRDELLGRFVVGAINLGHKRIAGFVSEFLVLGGLQPDGTVCLLGVDPGVEPGAPVA